MIVDYKTDRVKELEDPEGSGIARMECPSCGRSYELDSPKCPFCGKKNTRLF